MAVEFARDARGRELAEAVLELLQGAGAGGTAMDPQDAATLAEAARRRLAVEDESVGLLRSWWRRLLGPGREELTLARQRGEALERAERAEQASFEALSENARLKADLESALAEIEALRTASGKTPDTVSGDPGTGGSGDLFE